jgi:hypothetical protein
MDIQSINNIIFPSVQKVINTLKENNHEVKTTILREMFNEAINNALNIDQTRNISIKAMFSGRGRAWAKTKVEENNHAWIAIREALDHKILFSAADSFDYKTCVNIKDVFENSGIAWIRYGSSSKNHTVFHIRTNGSTIEKHVKVKIDNTYVLNGSLENLEGVPHRVGLETGNFSDFEVNRKEKINIPVSAEELGTFGIQTLEDVLNSSHV